MKWEVGFFSMGDMTCLDESAEPGAQVAAVFYYKMLSTSKSGELEVALAVQNEVLDEILVSGLAMYEYQRRAASRSSST